jgi:hypothetical protein
MTHGCGKGNLTPGICETLIWNIQKQSETQVNWLPIQETMNKICLTNVKHFVGLFSACQCITLCYRWTDIKKTDQYVFKNQIIQNYIIQTIIFWSEHFD